MADYYLDFDAGSALTGTVTFTNASTTISGSGTLFTTELAVGNYVRASAGTQWYKITAITDDFTATISPSFQQATVTDTAGATLKNAGDGSSTNPFCHLNQYTTDTIRTAGDRLLAQLGQTHVCGGIDIVFDEDGTSASPIAVVGSDWKATGATANTVIDFGGTTEQFYQAGDLYWSFENIDVTNSTDELAYLSSSHGTAFKNAGFYGGADGLYLATTSGMTIDTCNFHSNTVYNILVGGSAYIINSTFNGGAGTTDYGIRVYYGNATVINSAFGQTTAHDLYDFAVANGGEITCRNCLFDVAKTIIEHPVGCILSYDHQRVPGAFWGKFYNGIIEKDTVEVRTGGASSCIKATPNSNVSTNLPLRICEWNEFDVAAAAQTRTVYVKSIGVTTTFPTASQLWLEAEYYDAATGTTTTIAKSTEVLTADNTYTALSVSFTPGQVGRVVYRVYIAYHEGAESYYVDNQLV